MTNSLKEEIVDIILDCEPWEGHMDYIDRDKAAQKIISIFEKRIDERVKQLSDIIFDDSSERKIKGEKLIFNQGALAELMLLKEMLK